MMNRIYRSSARGSAAVEFLFCLPLLLLLAFPVFDLARVFQANMILTNMAREGANLASRTLHAEQTIMDSLAATAPPLDMRANGAIRITKILATRQGGILRNVVIAQYRWQNGSYDPPRGVWTCGAAGTYWSSDGSCAGLPPPASAPTIAIMSGALAEGDVVFLVETFYRFPLFFRRLQLGGYNAPDLDPDLYAMAIF